MARSADVDRPRHTVLDADPAFGAGLGLGHDRMPFPELENVFRADLDAHLGVVAKVVVDPYDRGLRLIARLVVPVDLVELALRADLVAGKIEIEVEVVTHRGPH